MKHQTTVTRFTAAAAALLCLCSLTACGGNPQADPAVQERAEALEANITKAATGPVEEPLTFSETFTSTDNTAEYSITLDQTLRSAALPVIEVVPHDLTGEDVRRVAQALFGDATFYDRDSVYEPDYSKAQLQENLAWLETYATAEGLTELYGSYDPDILDLLKQYQQLYSVQLEKAPEENPDPLCDWKFRREGLYTDYDNGNKIIFTTTKPGDVEYNIYAIIREKGDYKYNRIFVGLSDGLGLAQFQMAAYRAQLCRTSEPTQDRSPPRKARHRPCWMQWGSASGRSPRPWWKPTSGAAQWNIPSR